MQFSKRAQATGLTRPAVIESLRRREVPSDWIIIRVDWQTAIGKSPRR
jgi:hypothetical protein